MGRPGAGVVVQRPGVDVFDEAMSHPDRERGGRNAQRAGGDAGADVHRLIDHQVRSVVTQYRQQGVDHRFGRGVGEHRDREVKTFRFWVPPLGLCNGRVQVHIGRKARHCRQFQPADKRVPGCDDDVVTRPRRRLWPAAATDRRARTRVSRQRRCACVDGVSSAVHPASRYWHSVKAQGWSLIRCSSQSDRRLDQRVAHVIVLAVQGEQQPAVVAVVFLPPTRVGDGLVLVGIGEVLQVVVGHRHCQSILLRVRRQALGQRPRPQHPVLLQAQVEVRTGSPVVMQHEGGPGRHQSILRSLSAYRVVGRSHWNQPSACHANMCSNGRMLTPDDFGLSDRHYLIRGHQLFEATPERCPAGHPLGKNNVLIGCA